MTTARVEKQPSEPEVDVVAAHLHGGARLTAWVGVVVVLALCGVALQVEAPTFSPNPSRTQTPMVPETMAAAQSESRTPQFLTARMINRDEMPPLLVPPQTAPHSTIRMAPEVPAERIALTVMDATARRGQGPVSAAFDAPVSSTGAPVRVQKLGEPLLLVAHVTGPSGEPAGRHQVQWSIDSRGVGQITSVDADTPDVADVSTEQRSRNFARSVTSDVPALLPVTLKHADEFSMPPGSAWCLVDAQSPGDMIVTAVAPGIASATARQSIVRIHWDDAAARFPGKMRAPAASSANIATVVIDPITKRPRSGYAVRYVVEPAGASYESISDADGVAFIQLPESSATAGRTRIRGELFGGGPRLHGSPVLLAAAVFDVEWTAPATRIEATVPKTSGIGEWIPITVTMSKCDFSWPADTHLVARIPDGLAVLEGTSGGELDLGQPRQNIDLRRTFAIKSDAVCRRTLQFEVRGGARTWATSAVAIDFVAPTLTVHRDVPTHWWIHQPGDVRITIENTGPVTARSVRLTDQLPQGISVKSGDALATDDGLRWLLGDLEPGRKRSVSFEAVPRRVFERHAVVTRCGATNLPDFEVVNTLSVLATPALALSISDTNEPAPLDGQVHFEIAVENRGAADAEMIRFETRYAIGLELLDVEGPLPARIAGGKLLLGPVNRLAPNERSVCRVRCKAKSLGEARLAVKLVHPSVGPLGIEAHESTTIYRASRLQ